MKLSAIFVLAAVLAVANADDVPSRNLRTAKEQHASPKMESQKFPWSGTFGKASAKMESQHGRTHATALAKMEATYHKKIVAKMEGQRGDHHRGHTPGKPAKMEGQRGDHHRGHTPGKPAKMEGQRGDHHRGHTPGKPAKMEGQRGDHHRGHTPSKPANMEADWRYGRPAANMEADWRYGRPAANMEGQFHA